VITNNRTYFSFSGLKSHLQHIKIEDYEVDELKLIWEKELKDRNFTCDKKVTSAVMLKLGKIHGTKQFGNARAVCTEVSRTCYLIINSLVIVDKIIKLKIE
jgi:hypothetical protein